MGLSSFSFTSETNGIYTVSIDLTDRTHYSFNIGILPRNEQADDDFYYGIQPYITRAYRWGEGFQVPNYNAEESVNKILDTADYLGVKTNSPCIWIEKVYYDRLNQPIFCTDMYPHPANSTLRIRTEFH